MMHPHLLVHPASGLMKTIEGVLAKMSSLVNILVM